jgi:hypothetical protein
MKAERPSLGAAARVFGVLNALFGIAGLGGLAAVGSLCFDPLNSPIATLASLEALILIVSGLGLLLRKEWARRLTVVYALAAVVLRCVFLMLVSLAGAQTQVILLGVAQMVYLLLLIWFLCPSAREIAKGIGSMPRAMRQLAVVQFFTWFALFCMWIYFVPAVATKVFGGAPGSPEYQRGNEWGGVCFGVYNGTAFVFAFVLLALVRRFTARAIHRVCLLCGGGGLLLAFVLHQQYLLIGSMVLVGVAWASILSMPYAMLSNAIPTQKMGFYMGVFNFFIVIPQILVSLAMGPIVGAVFGGDSIWALVTGGVSLLVAAAATLAVDKAAGRAGTASTTGGDQRAPARTA